MVETNRQVGHLGYEAFDTMDISPEEEMDIRAENAHANAQAEVTYDVMEGQRCPGCEIPIQEDTGVECYCATEGYSRDHERMLWCSQDCQDRNHEIPYYVP